MVEPAAVVPATARLREREREQRRGEGRVGGRERKEATGLFYCFRECWGFFKISLWNAVVYLLQYFILFLHNGCRLWTLQTELLELSCCCIL